MATLTAPSLQRIASVPEALVQAEERRGNCAEVAAPGAVYDEIPAFEHPNALEVLVHALGVLVPQQCG